MTKFSLPKIACPAIVCVEIVAVIDPFFVGVCLSIKVYRYNPTEICQQRLQGVRNVAQKLCSWERSLINYSAEIAKLDITVTFLTNLGIIARMIQTRCLYRVLGEMCRSGSVLSPLSCVDYDLSRKKRSSTCGIC